MPQPRYICRPRTGHGGEPFATAGEAWLWYAHCQIARLEGVRFVAGAADIQRPCDPDDIYRAVDRLFRQRILRSAHHRAGPLRPPPGRPRRRRRRQRRRGDAVGRGPRPPDHRFEIKGNCRVTADAGTDGGWLKAVVAFEGRGGLWWLRLLKPGFRHCFIALSTPEAWVVIDPQSDRTDVTVVPAGPDYDLAAFYRGIGLVVVTCAPPGRVRRAAPWRPYSCVEAVKRILGIHAGFILTPWQLYRRLTVQEKNP